MEKTTNETPKWYTIKVQANREKSVVDRLKIEMSRNNYNFDILIPTEKSFFVKNGKRFHKDKIMYPGYIFIESAHLGELMNTLKIVPGASGLVKNKSGEIQILKQAEINKMMGDLEKEKEKDSSSYFKFIVGEEVKIIGGPFTDFKGVIDEINPEKQKVKVSVPIFGRKTLVDLELIQIEKILV